MKGITENWKQGNGKWPSVSCFSLETKNSKLKTILLAVAVFLSAALPAWAEFDKESIKPKLAKLGVPFIENQGQIKDPSVKFYANTFAGTVFVNDKGEIVYSLVSKVKGQGSVVASETLHGNTKGKIYWQ